MGAGALGVNWGFAETMAYASLLDEGYPVRLTGQDVGRERSATAMQWCIVSAMARPTYR